MRYSMETGRITDENGRYLDKVIDSAGYRLVIMPTGKYRPAHRVAYWLVTGHWPKNEIDHRNRVKHDNRWSNLRDATKGENAQNRKVYRTNKLGVRGVRLRPDGWYEPRLTYKGRAVYLGIYRDLDVAVNVRKHAEAEYFTHAV